MSIWLKQSTAVTVKFGPFLDSIDGDTEENSLTISQADIRLSKNGGNIAQTNNAAGATFDESGMYDIPLDTTDTGTLGDLWVGIHESGALYAWERYMVLSANVWDSLFGADKLQVDVTQIAGTTQDATDLGDFAADGYDPATKKITGVVLVDTTTTNTDMVTEPPTAVQNRQEMDSNSTELAKIGTIPALDGAAQTVGAAIGKLADDNGGADYNATDDSLERIANTMALASVCTEGRLAELDAANLPSDLDDTLADTNEMQGKLPTNNIMGSSVKTDKDDEIDTINTATIAIQAKTDNLPDGIKKNTALANFQFVMISSTDNVSPKTGLGAGVTCERSIDGAAFSACTNTASEISAGFYKITLSAADLNGDTIGLKFTASGANATMMALTTQI